MPNYVSSGTESIGKGTTLYNPYVCYSGRVNVYSGGLVSSAYIYSGGREYVYAGGSDTGAFVYSGGGLEVMMSGIAINPYVISSSYISASGGFIYSGIVGNGGIMTLKGYDIGSAYVAGYASNLRVLSGGSVDIGWKGVGSHVRLESGNVTIYSGGTMQGSYIGSGTGDSRGAIVHVKPYALAHANYIHSNGMMLVSSAGTATATRVYTGGSAIAYSGGLLSGTIASGGVVDLKPGGSAVSTTIHRDTVASRGGMWVSAGAVATSTTIESAGTMTLESGGVALGSSFLRDGAVSVGSGASVFNFFVSGGDFRVSAGAAASAINVGGGYLRLLSGASGFAYGEWISIYGSGIAYVNSGAILSSSFVQAGGSTCVMSGGSAVSVEVSSGGRLHLSGGRASKAYVFTSGQAQVHEGGVIVGGNVFGSVTVLSGGTASGLDIKLLGQLIVNGRASNCTIYSGGVVVVSSGGKALGAYASTGGNFLVHSGGTATISGGTGISATASSGGRIHVSGGQVRVANVEGGVVYIESASYLSRGNITEGTLVIDSGCSANDVAAYGNPDRSVVAQLTVYSGGKTSNGHIFGEVGSMLVVSGGQANSMTIDSLGCANVRGTIDTCFVSSGGKIYVSSGGAVASRTTIGIDGEMQVFGGGKAEIAVIGTGGELMVYYNASANLVNVNGGLLTMSSGGTATSAYIREGGSAVVSSQAKITSANVYSGGMADVRTSGYLYSAFVSSGGLVRNSGGLLGDVRVLSGGTVVCQSGTVWGQVSSGGDIVFSGGWTDTLSVSSGGRVRMAGYVDFTYTGGIVFSGGTMDFDISNHASAGESVLLDGYDAIDDIGGNLAVTLTVGIAQKEGTYMLASYADSFDKTITVKNIEGTDLGALSLGGKTTIGAYDYTLAVDVDDVLTVTVEAAVPVPLGTAKSDVDGNGISDVMFVWTGNDYAHGYWMNGTNEWRSTGSNHPAEWVNLGCYDMAGDGKADSVLVGNVEVSGVKGAYIGYYADAVDAIDGSTWVNIDYLNNEANVTWINKIGNLTGGSANSIVWYAPDLYTLGAWTEGTSNWVTITGNFGGDDWKLVGCGDFNGDGLDSVVMSGANGTYFYAADLDGAVTSLGAANWTNWEVRAIGDFKGDGKDDMVLFHQETGSMVMLANGNLDDFTSIGQLDAADWFVVGAGDYNADAKDDLLVRQYSTGMLGYYSGGDTTQWNVLGYGVSMEWTVIA